MVGHFGRYLAVCLAPRMSRSIEAALVTLCAASLVWRFLSFPTHQSHLHRHSFLHLASEQRSLPYTDLQVDQFAFAIILNECMTGQQPWQDLQHPMQVMSISRGNAGYTDRLCLNTCQALLPGDPLRVHDTSRP